MLHWLRHLHVSTPSTNAFRQLRYRDIKIEPGLYGTSMKVPSIMIIGFVSILWNPFRERALRLGFIHLPLDGNSLKAWSHGHNDLHDNEYGGHTTCTLHVSWHLFSQEHGKYTLQLASKGGMGNPSWVRGLNKWLSFFFSHFVQYCHIFKRHISRVYSMENIPRGSA